MNITQFYIPPQQHGTRAPVSVVAAEAILLLAGGHVLLQCGSFMAQETDLLLGNRQEHFNSGAFCGRVA